jgi:hypothetical protein
MTILAPSPSFFLGSGTDARKKIGKEIVAQKEGNHFFGKQVERLRQFFAGDIVADETKWHIVSVHALVEIKPTVDQLRPAKTRQTRNQNGLKGTASRAICNQRPCESRSRAC